MITIWVIGLVLFIIGCFIAKLYNKWVLANFSRIEGQHITRSVIPIIGIASCLPFVGVAASAIFITIILINWIYLKYKDKWNDPF